MTDRPLLSVTIYPPWKVGEPYYAITMSALLTPNPSRPFNQYEWPRPKEPGRVQASDAPANLYPIQHPNPSRPFVQSLWENEPQPAKLKATGETFSSPDELLTRLPPFFQTQWDNPTQLAKTEIKREPLGTLNPVLTPNPKVPFVQLDWYQIRVTWKSKVDDDFTVNLTPLQTGTTPAVKPLTQTEWRLTATPPLKVNETACEAQGPQPLYNPTPAQPFIQSEWPHSAYAVPPPNTVDQVLLLPLYITVTPFAQNDWTLVPAVPKAKVDDVVNVTLLESRIQFPFFQSDFTRVPALKKVIVDDVVNVTLLESRIISPFYLNDWRNPAPAKPAIPDSSVAAVSPLFNPNPARPFFQTFWDNPVLSKQPIKSDIYVNLAGGVQRPTPFQYNDWFTVSVARQKIAADSFGIDLPLKFPNPTLPFTYTDWPRTTDAKSDVQRNGTWLDPFNLPLNGIIAPPPGLPPLQITDTHHLQLPIDAVLMGQQDMEVGESVIEANPMNVKTKTIVSVGGVGKLSKDDPTFTVKRSTTGRDD